MKQATFKFKCKSIKDLMAAKRIKLVNDDPDSGNDVIDAKLTILVYSSSSLLESFHPGKNYKIEITETS